MIAETTLRELLLAGGIKNAEELARELILRFHSLDGVVSQDAKQLAALAGERAAMLIKLSAALASRRVIDDFEYGVSYTEEEIKKFLVALFRGSSVETLYLISLGENGEVLSCDFISEGTVNAANILPRQIIEPAVRNRAAGVIIAHNHPAGFSWPSTDDVSFTSTVRNILGSAGISLVSHITVAGSECSTLK